MKVRSLSLTFTNTAGAKGNIIFQHVKENIAKADVDALANHLISANLVISKGEELKTFLGAKITETEKSSKDL